MEIKINLDLNQILGLIRQLPEKDIEKLALTLQSEISHQKSRSSLKSLILEAPTWNESDYENYQNVRQHINESRIA